MERNNFILYLHVAPNGKKYFGITGQTPKQRWKSNGYGYKKNEHFWNAIQLYGWDNMQHIVLADDLTKEEACLFERAMIAIYNTNNRDYGYNETDGGEHYKHSERTKQKISESHKGRKNSRSKAVICITTGYCFGSTGEAARWLNLNNGCHIRNCCAGRRKTAHELPDGTRLRWKYISNLPRPNLTESEKSHLRYLLDRYNTKTA
jgi:hypothetical protein